MLAGVPTLYTAPAVVTGEVGVIADGGVLVDGERIAAVAPAAELDAAATRRHHVDGALLPALVDAATLAELSDAIGASEPPEPATALHRASGVGADADDWSTDRRQRSARRGAQRLLRGGVGLAVDHVRFGAGVPALSRTHLPGDSLVDVGAVTAGEADDVAAAVRTALGRRAPGRRVGVATAAPPDDGDVAALATLVGAVGPAPLRVVTRPGRPVDLDALAHADALRPGTTVGPNPALDVAEARRLAVAGVTVLVVPRGACPPDLATLAEGGVEVALGGGLAAVPDPLAHAAAFADLAARAGLDAWPAGAAGASAATPSPAPSGSSAPSATLAGDALALVTGPGARHLGWGEVAGTLATGRRADFVALDAPEAAAGDAAALLAAAGRQVLTVVAGVQRARRAAGDVDWPPIDRQDWREQDG